MTETTYMKRAIADYIIDTLAACQGPLDQVKLFVRGALSPGVIPQDQYPFSEVFVSEETEDFEMTGGMYNQTYVGIVTFTVTMAAATEPDMLDKIGERLAHVPSYDLVEELVHTAVFELQKAQHRSMGDLAVMDEVVVQFTITGPRIFGIDRDLRTNNWENFGSLPFQVQTERVRL